MYVAVVLVGLPLVQSANAQRATLLGTIADQSDAVIEGVKVTLLNLDQGLKREATTGNTGYYTVPLLQPGHYLVTAEKAGFAVAEVKGLVLHVEDVRLLNIKLHVGIAPVAIQVSERSEEVETASAALGQIVTGDVIRDAPLNGRNVLALTGLQPAVTPVDPDSLAAGQYNITGNRSDSISYLLDGGMNSDLVDDHAVYTPNPDTIAEFRILASNYPAEYGRNSGGVISLVTRSGTNQLHGSLFDFLRNDALDANRFFNKSNQLPRDVLKRNQFGGTLGGPITIPNVVHGKDRFFFFVGYQGQRQVQVTSVHNIATFTPAEVAGDFSHAGLGGGVDPGVAGFLRSYPFFQPDPNRASRAIIDPSRINSVARNYMAAGLIPTSPTGLLSWQGTTTTNYDELTGKFDLNLDARDKLAITLGWDREDDLGPFVNYAANVPGFSSSSDFRVYFLNVSYIRSFSTNLLNELRVTTQRTETVGLNPAAKLATPSDLGIAITPDLPVGPTNLVFDSGMRVGFSYDGPQRLTDNSFTYTDTLTWIRGRHDLKFGAGWSAYQDNAFYAFNVDGQFLFVGTNGNGSQNSFADFLLGIPYQYTQASAAPSNIRSKFMFGFGQDEWRLRKNLVLTLGLRYEYSTPKSDTMGRTFSIIPGRQSQVFIDAPLGMLFPGDPGAPQGVNFPDPTNWAPRVGFAWDPTGKGKMSLRGAFGKFYDILKGEDNLQFNGQPPFFAGAGFTFSPLAGNPTSEVNYLSQPFLAAGVENPFPSRRPPADLDFAAEGYLPIGASTTVFVVDPRLHTPYTYQYHLTLQQALAKNTIAEAGYVGSSSHGLTSLVDVNPFVLGTYDRILNLTPGNDSCTVNAGTCSFANLEEFRNVTSANYNGLLLSLVKQASGDGILGHSHFTAAYTYSHNIDNASGFPEQEQCRPLLSASAFPCCG